MVQPRSASPPKDEVSPTMRKARMAALVRQARRAGRVVIGVKLNREAARDRRLSAALVADDLAPARRDVLVEMWRSAGIAVYTGWSKDELGELAGRAAVAVLGLLDRNIAAGLAAIEGAAGQGRMRQAAKEETEQE
jgi:ribosomal protein L7Ae-like RNA K-turn-binding protein